MPPKQEQKAHYKKFIENKTIEWQAQYVLFSIIFQSFLGKKKMFWFPLFFLKHQIPTANEITELSKKEKNQHWHIL